MCALSKPFWWWAVQSFCLCRAATAKCNHACTLVPWSSYRKITTPKTITLLSILVFATTLPHQHCMFIMQKICLERQLPIWAPGNLWLPICGGTNVGQERCLTEILDQNAAVWQLPWWTLLQMLHRFHSAQQRRLVSTVSLEEVLW